MEKTMNSMNEAEMILEKAKKRGIESDFLFCTTFERYRTQIRTLELLESEIVGKDVLVHKVYANGNEKLIVNPAIREYNTLVSCANGTVGTLISILRKLTEEPENKKSKFASFLAAFSDDD